MRKPELAAAIADKADLTKDQANRVLNAVLEEITNALNRKDSVTLVGFGTFVQRHRGARTGKNPQTGEPVKIKDLAAKMIHLSGLSVRDASNPQGDIAIEVVGLRPGEKLYEELLISGEATGTKHPRICQVREDGADGSLLDAELRALENAIRAKSGDFDVRLVLARWVRGYTGAAGGIAAGAAPDGQPLTLH